MSGITPVVSASNENPSYLSVVLIADFSTGAFVSLTQIGFVSFCSSAVTSTPSLKYLTVYVMFFV